MRKLYTLIITFFIFTGLIHAQNVGIGTANPQEKLHVEGGIKIGFTTGTAPGSIRFNPATQKFEGRDSTSWNAFGFGGAGAWIKDGINIYPDTNDVFSGNVGIGVVVPLTKLHVKANANGIAIRAEGGNTTVPAIDAISLIGHALKAVTQADSISAIYAYSQNGTAIRAYSSSGLLPALWVVSDSSYGIIAETQSDTLPALQAFNKDSAGFAAVFINKASIDTINNKLKLVEGGNAALFLGDADFRGALRNSDTTLYGGSVAVNDGMTVGNISGASCIPNTQVSGTYDSTFNYYLIFGTGAPTWNHFPSLNAGGADACRSITNFHFKVTMADAEGFPLSFTARVRGQFIGSVNVSNANLNLVSPFPPYYPNGALDTFYYNSSNDYYISRWAWDQHYWDGQDPNGTNWYVKLEEHAGDGDYLLAYSGRIDYKWADSTAAPIYAAFGEIRASGSIYANSNQLLGDLAEFFAVTGKSRKPEPGDLVAISKNNPQAFELTTEPYQPLLVGAISENPSVFLNTPEAGEPVALTGRVKVKVNMEGGRIMPGDPITSSSTQGVGMKANKGGMILGYALEAFDGSRTSQGKIWIMLARGHVEKVHPDIVHQVDNPELRGMRIAGAIKVKENESTVHIPWDTRLSGKIPADVEFNDLYIELTPFGGEARMIIKNVDATGVTVDIIQRNEGFKGFYYSTEILTAALQRAEEQKNAAVKKFASSEEREAYAKELIEKQKQLLTALQNKSDISMQDLQKLRDPMQQKSVKQRALQIWKTQMPELFAQWEQVRKELDAVIAHDQTVLRDLRE
ncbi:MAG: hypothetical protein KatS3mg031_1046 [Chitinophagales bacterium]|nr:MAG: hypothetical protein KatS3mg031_1046 [Chitinophagales bacterium]